MTQPKSMFSNLMAVTSFWYVVISRVLASYYVQIATYQLKTFLFAFKVVQCCIFLTFMERPLCLRRGVRSDAQLSPTETRFQKCSQSGKNGSKHPMLSIPMAFNVISCKKVERNTQKLKISDFTM